MAQIPSFVKDEFKKPHLLFVAPFWIESVHFNVQSIKVLTCENKRQLLKAVKGKASLNIHLKTHLWYSVTMLMEQEQAAGKRSRHRATNFSVC